MTDANGNILWHARYAAWGKLVFESTTSHAPRGFEQNLRMQGQYDDRITGLYYNTFRYYDPDIGRFTTEDPIGLLGGLNLYQYTPNPLSWIDPWGWEGEWVNPNDVNFSQRSISQNNYAEKMQNGQWDWNRKGAPLRVMEVDGQLVSYDNRRLDAARAAGLEKIPVERVNPKAQSPVKGLTWEEAFNKRRNDPRNVAIAGPVPAKGLSGRPTCV